MIGKENKGDMTFGEGPDDEVLVIKCET